MKELFIQSKDRKTSCICFWLIIQTLRQNRHFGIGGRFCFIHERIIRALGSKCSLTIVVSAQGLEAVTQFWRLEGHNLNPWPAQTRDSESFSVINCCCAGASEQGTYTNFLCRTAENLLFNFLYLRLISSGVFRSLPKKTKLNWKWWLYKKQQGSLHKPCSSVTIRIVLQINIKWVRVWAAAYDWLWEKFSSVSN